MTAAQIARELVAIQERLRKLERFTQLAHSSVVDDDGNDVDVAASLLTANTAALTAAEALESAVSAQATADGLVTIYTTADPPSGDELQFGDWWTPPPGTVAYTWDGDTWILAENATLAAAFNAAALAQDTADGKIKTYWQSTAPVTGEQGDLWFQTPDNTPYRYVTGSGWTPIVAGTVASADYQGGDQGWAFNADDRQVPDLNVIGELGAGSVATDSLTIAGVDIADQIAADGAGVVSYARSWGQHTADIGSTETKLFEFNGGTLDPTRMYRITVHGHLDGTNSGDSFDIRMRYTTDGSAPSTSSAVMDGTLTRVNIAGAESSSFYVVGNYVPATTAETVRFAMTLKRASGTGTAKIFLTDQDRCIEFLLEDMGLFSGTTASGGAGVLSQKSVATGGTTDPDPTQTYTRSWLAEWSRSYDENDGTRDGDDTNDMYQGYYSGTHGRTKSLCGFNDADIRAKLTGATILGVWITFRVKYRGWSDGLDVYINQHDYDTKPSTWSDARVDEAIANRQNCAEGSTYKVSLPLSVGTKFKSGDTKGLGFGPGPDNGHSNYGRLYGEGSSYRPRLTIRYEK